MERFVGKIAVVTGSSAGIGEALSKKLVMRGIIVVGLARNVKKLQEISEELSKNAETYTGKFHGLQCDVTKEEDIVGAFQKIKSDIGPISILVNNAGTVPPQDRYLQDTNGEIYDTTFDTNVKGLLLCAKEAIKSMTENSIAGHILNINSIISIPTFNVDGSILYKASKHASRVLATELRKEMARKQSYIKISNISPGGVDTEMVKKFNSESIVAAHGNAASLVLSVDDLTNAVISVLDTPANVLISELTVVPIHQDLFIDSLRG